MLFVFVTVMLFYGGPLAEISSSPLPLIDVLYRATGSRPATNALIAFLILVVFLAMFNILASVSRLIWCFSLDKGLPFSDFFSKVSYITPTGPVLYLMQIC
jgi:choline transport protein